MSNHWMPESRVGQLTLAKQWQPVITAKATAWNIPAAEATAFTALITAADAALKKVQDKATRIHTLPVSQSETVPGWRNILVALAGSRCASYSMRGKDAEPLPACESFCFTKLWAHGRAVFALYPPEEGSVRL